MDGAEDLDRFAFVALDDSMMPDKAISANLEIDAGIDPTTSAEVENVCIPAVEVVALIDNEYREDKIDESMNRDEEETFDSEEVHRLKGEELEHTITEAAHNICTTLRAQQVHSDSPEAKIDAAHDGKVKTIQPTWKDTDAPLTLLNLPIDSLHCIASFVTASDWASFGLTNTTATPICRDVFQRVRMHGFRCATEVVTAWVSEPIELSAIHRC
jgi:hypothetical protein